MTSGAVCASDGHGGGSKGVDGVLFVPSTPFVRSPLTVTFYSASPSTASLSTANMDGL